MKKAEKHIFVENLTQDLKGASSIYLVDHQGLSVKMQQDLKKRLKAVGGKMVVVKNTLFKIAGKDANYPSETLEDTVLSGPTALITGTDDAIAPLQVLAIFAKEFELPNLKVGVVDGKFQDKDALTILSQLPSKEILLGQTVGTIGAPLYGIVGVLQGNLQKLVWILSQKAKS